MKIIKRRSSSENPLDSHYRALNCSLTPLTRDDDDFKVSLASPSLPPSKLDLTSGLLQLVSEFMQSTHAKTHNQYALRILDIFETQRSDEASLFKDYGQT